MDWQQGYGLVTGEWRENACQGLVLHLHTRSELKVLERELYHHTGGRDTISYLLALEQALS